MEELGKFIIDKWFEIIQALKIVIPLIISAYKKLIFRIRNHGYSQEVMQIASAINNISWSNLSQPLTKIDKVGLIHRPEIDQILEIWEDSDLPILVIGEAGTGKTGIAIRVGQYTYNKGTPVLYLNSKDFPLDGNPITFLEQRLTVNITLVKALSLLSKENNSVVIVDQLDSVAGTNLCKGLISLIKTLTAIPNIKVLAVTRSYEYRNDPDISTISFQTIECNQLSQEQAKEYLAQIGVTKINSTIVDLSRNLLNLSIIADIIKADPLSIKHITDEVKLWKQFFISTEKREGEEIADYALKLARDATRRNELNFQVPYPRNKPFWKLISRGVISPAPVRRYSFRHEQMQYFLCSYDLLPEKPDVDKLISEFSGKALTSVITWLHRLYHDESPELEAIFVDEILSAEKALSFYTRISVLDVLKHQLNPSNELAKVIFKYKNNEHYQKFFFTDLNNPEWVKPLFSYDLFSEIPEPIEIKKGSFQIPIWLAGEYLLRFAQENEEIIIKVVEASHTKNWQAQELLIDALMKISPEKAAEQVSKVDFWVDSRFSDMLPNKLVLLTEYFYSKNQYKAAIDIFKYVLKPILLNDPLNNSWGRTPFRFRSDPYWVNAYVQKIFPLMLETRAADFVSIFEEHIILMLDITSQIEREDPELLVGKRWRIDIPYRYSNRTDADVVDVLVDGLRDSLVELCSQSIEEGRERLVTYLNGEHLIFHRIAIYALRKYGEYFPDLVEREMTKTENLGDKVLDDDYRGLLRGQFGTISPYLRKEIINYLLSGPSNVEEQAKYWARLEKREPTENDTQLAQDLWRLRHLAIIQEYLPDDVLDVLNALTEKYGKPDIRERPSIEFGPVTTVQSPISEDELSAMNFQTLKEYFKTYEPETNYMHSRDSLGRAIKSVVSDNGTKYLDFAPLLIDDNIRLVYTYYYLQGITEGIKTNAIQLENDILHLCHYVVCKNTEPDDPQRELHEPGLDVAKGQVADLLDEVVKKNDYYLSREQLDTIRGMMFELAHHPDPTEEKEKESSMDPFTYSLNCIRGRAMHGILDYSRYLVRQKADLEGKDHIPGFLEDPVVRLLDEKIDISIEKSPAVHSVFGAYLTQLVYLSKEWVVRHLDQLFPSAPEQEIYWRGAWDGYIFGSNAFNDVFKMLIPQYQRGLKLLGNPRDTNKYWGGQPDEHLAQHVMVVYLRGLTDFGHENKILDLFFDNAPDQIRAQAIFWLSKVLESEKKERILTEESEVWQRCWKLWQTRLDKTETEEVTKNGLEISDYMRWLVSAPMTLDQLYETLLKSVKYFQDRFDVMQLLDYVEKYREHSPRESVTLLWETISSAKEPWWRADETVEGNILRVAMTSGDEKARQIAVDIINLRGEQGFYRWRELLNL